MESRAEKFLRQQGLQSVTRNYRTRLGEIDLIMRDKQTLVFVEVRYRKSNRWGSALESIGYRKQQRLVAAAQDYLSKTDAETAARFDVVTYDGQTDKPSEWISNAFEADA